MVIMIIANEFKKITSIVDEMTVFESVDDCKDEYVNDDWEDEFDDINEAYEEQGRGGAEYQVINQIIIDHCPGLEGDGYIELYDLLADHWNLTTS
jgi:hypothetical protein